MELVSTTKAPPERRVHRDPPAHSGVPAMADAVHSAGAVAAVPRALPGGTLLARQVMYFQRTIGNAATGRAIAGDGRNGPGLGGGTRLPASAPSSAVWRSGTAPRVQRSDPPAKSAPQASLSPGQVAFVREEGLNLRERADQQSKSLSRLSFGQRVYVLDDPEPHPSWKKVVVPGQTGYVFAPRIHFPPEALIAKDPGLRLIRVKPGQTFWGLVKDSYGIQGNESTPDQNINHFINAIRAVNKPEAFDVRSGTPTIPGRDAAATYLKANVDLWIPSFGVAAAMDVGSGTLRGEEARFYKQLPQRIVDFQTACTLSKKYTADAIAKHAGETGEALLKGLVDFVIDAAKILAASTAAGALIGAFFEGVGAVPGALIGFEIGLIILEYYGLVMVITAIVQIAANLAERLGEFAKLVWTANGDQKQLDEAGKVLADALGILASAAVIALAAYVTKKGFETIGKTKFAQAVGESRLADGLDWLKKRQQMTTTKDVLQGRQPAKPTATGGAKPTGRLDQLIICRVCDKVLGVPPDLMAKRAKLSVQARDRLDKSAGQIFTDPPNPTTAQFDSLRKFVEAMEAKGGGDLEKGLQQLIASDAKRGPKPPPPAKPPFGPEVHKLPKLRGDLQGLIAEIEAVAKANPDKATIERTAVRLRQQLDGPVKRMEDGVEAAEHESVISVERAIKGGSAELDRAKAAPAGTKFGEIIDGVEIDEVHLAGKYVQNKSMRALRKPSRTFDETVDQIKRTLRVAKNNPVAGKPPDVIFNFPEGLEKDIATELRGIQVDGRSATINAPVIVLPPK